jgi:3-deoxy-D-manno-octulosonate 8-phosphate phosphatase (KDO 8-P phosphatase)
MNLPKVVFTDIDGVWTDGGMYYDQSGNELKKFNTRDSAGLLFLRQLEIPVVVLTGEDTQIMRNRAEKLKLEFVYHGVKDKVAVAKSFCESRGISLADVAFIGDDLLDLPLLTRVGFSACPSDAAAYTQSIVHYVSPVCGGEGAFRDFVEEIMRQSGVYQNTIDHWLNK